MTKKILDVSFVNQRGRLVCVYSYDDGSKFHRIVSENQIEALLDEVKNTNREEERKYPVGTVIKGGKKEKGSGEIVLLILLSILVFGLLSGRGNELDPKCTGPKWFKYETCRRFHDYR